MRKIFIIAAFALCLSISAPAWAGTTDAGSQPSPATADAAGPAVEAPAEDEVTLEDIFQDVQAPEAKGNPSCPGGTAPSCQSVEGSTCYDPGGWTRCYEYNYCEWFICFCTGGQWDCEYP